MFIMASDKSILLDQYQYSGHCWCQPNIQLYQIWQIMRPWPLADVLLAVENRFEVNVYWTSNRYIFIVPAWGQINLYCKYKKHMKIFSISGVDNLARILFTHLQRCKFVIWFSKGLLNKPNSFSALMRGWWSWKDASALSPSTSPPL